MSVQVITINEAARAAVDALDVDLGQFALTSPEGIAASLRRAASFLCPATQRQLADAVLNAVNPLAVPDQVTRSQVNSTLDALVLNGDLVEAVGDDGQRLLFLGPPSFVQRTQDSCLVIGIRPSGERLVRSDKSLRLEYRRHARLCRSEGPLAKDALLEQGLHEIGAKQWARVPDTAAAIAVLDAAIAVLDEVKDRRGRSGEIPGLRVIDRAKPVRYYKGRWRELEAHDMGLMIGRRPQEYGADLWCVVRVKEGHPVLLVDLPVLDKTKPGCDEAWRLQAALDHVDGHPQVFAVAPANDGAVVLDCFSPVPSWAEKMLAMKGEPTTKSQGALFSYRLPEDVIDEISGLLVEKLWMQQLEQEVN